MVAKYADLTYAISGMKLKQTLMFTLPTIGLLALALPVPAMAADAPLRCNILPQSICDQSKEGKLTDSGTWLLLMWIINILSAGVGFVAVAVIAYAGFLYATAQDSADQTKKSKEMIRNVAVGIMVYALMYAATQWLIPGGAFK